MTPQDSPEARIAALVQQIMSAVRWYTGLGKGCYCESETVDGQRYVTWKCGDCAIREALEAALHEQAQEIERVNALLRVTTGHEGGGSITCGHCGHRIASDGVIEALTAEIKRAEAAESALAAAKQAFRELAERTDTNGDMADRAVHDFVIAALTQGHTSPGGSPEGRSRAVPKGIDAFVEELHGTPYTPEGIRTVLLAFSAHLRRQWEGEVAESRTDKEDQ